MLRSARLRQLEDGIQQQIQQQTNPSAAGDSSQPTDGQSPASNDSALSNAPALVVSRTVSASSRTRTQVAGSDSEASPSRNKPERSPAQPMTPPARIAAPETGQNSMHGRASTPDDSEASVVAPAKSEVTESKETAVLDKVSTASIVANSIVAAAVSPKQSSQASSSHTDDAASATILNGASDRIKQPMPERAAVTVAVDPAEAIRGIERKLRSYGPYVRVFRTDDVLEGIESPEAADGADASAEPAQKAATPPTQRRQPLQRNARSHTPIPGVDVAYGSAKELNLVDISAPRPSAATVTSPIRMSAYPTVIRAPASLGRVTVGVSSFAASATHGYAVSAMNPSIAKSTTSGGSGRAGSPSQVTLARPIFPRQGPRYARSNSASRTSRRGPISLARESAPAASRRSLQIDHTPENFAPSAPSQIGSFSTQVEHHLASMPMIPFLDMTNSLQLHLKLNVLTESERIVAWIPGSFVVQSNPFLDENRASALSNSSGPNSPHLFRLGSVFRSLVRTLSTQSTESSSSSSTQTLSPGYLLLTSAAVYIFRPSFSLFCPKIPIIDEQTSYLDPSGLLELVCRFPHLDIARIDVGPSRQHLVFRVMQNTQSVQQASHSVTSSISATTASHMIPPIAQTTSSQSNARNSRARPNGAKLGIASWVFLTRSRSLSTHIIDYLTTQMHEIIDGPLFSGFVNQDIEYTLRNLKNCVFLRHGPKDVTILSYNGVWMPLHSIPDTTGNIPNHEQQAIPASESAPTLSTDEADSATVAEITKVDFDFLRFYTLGCFLRYIRPMKEVSTRSVKLEHVSIIGTSDYIYVASERLDVWPPLIVPPEFSPHPTINARIDGIVPGLSQEHGGKGYLADAVPHFENVLGVGRMSDVLRIERWRTWRIDAALGLPGEPPSNDFQGLGEALQNGFVGFFGPDAARIRSEQQQGTASGWLWWVRIIFGKRLAEEARSSSADAFDQDYAMPMSAPTSVPCSTRREKVQYWWDLAFSTREAVDELFEAIQAAHDGLHQSSVTVVSGDD